MFLALGPAHQATHLAQQRSLEHVCHKRRSLLNRWHRADVVLHFAVGGRGRWQGVRNILKFCVEAIEHVAEKLVSVVLVIAFEGRHDFPHHQKQALGRNR